MVFSLFDYGAARKVVGVHVHDGLGNQLFEYAAGYRLARRYGGMLRLETRYFRQPGTKRQLALDHFNIELKRCMRPNARGLLRAMGRVFRPNLMELFHQTGRAFDPAFDDLRPPIFLIGYFQSWRYFAGYDDELRHLLSPAHFASQATKAIEGEISASSCPVMVHIRRGDYVGLAGPTKFRLLGAEYYETARRRIEERHVHPDYFVFSDDPAAARALVGDWSRASFVSGHSMFEDLFLMSRCQHFIIANSTFSWWAAFLGQKADSLTVAPERYYREGAAGDFRPTDLYPPTWLLI